MFKRNYSKKRMPISLTIAMIVSIIVSFIFIAGELSLINSTHDSQMKSCLKSLDCGSDLECFELAVKKCGYTDKFKAY